MFAIGITLIPSLTGATPLRFPTRGDELPPNHYIHTRGHAGGATDYPVDYGVLRWDSNAGDWSHWTEDLVGDPDTLEEDLSVGTQLYAPEDGRVIACFRNTVDQPNPTVHACAGGCPSTVYGAGNFLVIQSDDEDHAVLFAHFKYDTIPEELCPNTLTDADASTFSGGSSYPDNTRLDIVNSGIYPEVYKGDLLGEIGHTGNSSEPHGHVEVHPLTLDSNDENPVRGSDVAIEWYEGYYQDRADLVAPSATWNAMNGHVVVYNDPIIIIPDPIGIQREDYDYNHDASNLNLTTHTDGGVMAYMDGSGGLDVRSYDLDSAGEVTLQSLVNEGTIVDVSVARPNTTRSVIVSIRGTNDNLKLIPYQVTSGGTITRQVGKEVTEGDIGFVDSIKSPAHNGVTLAVENSSGNLQVIDYHVDSSLNVSRDLGGDGTGGAIQAVEMTGLTVNFTGVVTIELVQSTGGVKLRSFDVAGSGGVSNAGIYTTLLTATDVDIDTVGAALGFDEYVVTSVRLSSGDLRLDSWEVDALGDFTWVSTISAGTISALDGAALGRNDFLTSVRDASDNLRLISWMVYDDGQLRRNGTQIAGPVTEVLSLPAVASSSHIVTLVSDDVDDLRLLSFDENFAFGI